MYDWNKYGVCVNSTAEEIFVKHRYRATILYAERDQIWHGSVELEYGYEGVGGFPSFNMKQWRSSSKDELIRELWAAARDMLQNHIETSGGYSRPELGRKLLKKIDEKLDKLRIGQMELFV